MTNLTQSQIREMIRSGKLPEEVKDSIRKAVSKFNEKSDELQSALDALSEQVYAVSEAVNNYNEARRTLEDTTRDVSKMIYREEGHFSDDRRMTLSVWGDRVEQLAPTKDIIFKYRDREVDFDCEGVDEMEMEEVLEDQEMGPKSLDLRLIGLNLLRRFAGLAPLSRLPE